MAFDVGKAIAGGLILGTVYGAFRYGIGYIAGKIEAWKDARWAKKHKHLDPLEFVARSVARDRRRNLTSLLILIGACLLLVVGLLVLGELTKA